jgi:serine acetyltransferase
LSILQELRADAQFYRQLRFPTGVGPIKGRLACVTSAGLFVLAMHRIGREWQSLRQARRRPFRRAWLRGLIALGQPLLIVRAKADVVSEMEVAPGVHFSDRGHFVMGARSIGSGTIVHHAVTIGMSLMNQGKPTIGKNVWIGPDCVLYGNIEVGDGATLLGGTVLTKSIPANTLVAGNPARVIKRHFDNTHLRSSLDYDVRIESDSPGA